MWKGSFRARPPSKTVEDVRMKLSREMSFKNWLLQVGKTTPEAALTVRGRCACDLPHVSCTRRAANIPHPPSEAPFVLQNSKRAILPCLRIRYLPKTRFVRAFPQKVKVEDVETTFLCETSFKGCKSKMWNWSFRARLPSKTASWRYGNEAFVLDLSQKLKEAFVRDFPSKLKAQDLKMKDSCCSDHHCIDHHCSDNLCCDHHCSDFQSSG